MNDPISSLSEFVERVAQISKEWKASTQHQLWFRGESDATSKTSLMPKLYRPDKPIGELIKHERFLFEEFQARGSHLSEYDDFDPIGWYFVMQHYGAPTRLLDWFDGALIALHFAIIERTTDALKENSCVYVLDPDWLDEETPKLKPEDDEEEEDEDWEIKRYLPADEDVIPIHPLNVPLAAFTPRIAAQRSQFVLFGTDRAWLCDKKDKGSSRLRSICIERSKAGEMQSQLRACGITESVIFPDLDGLGREMVDLWRRLRTE